MVTLSEDRLLKRQPGSTPVGPVNHGNRQVRTTDPTPVGNLPGENLVQLRHREVFDPQLGIDNRGNPRYGNDVVPELVGINAVLLASKDVCRTDVDCPGLDLAQPRPGAAALDGNVGSWLPLAIPGCDCLG